MENHDDTIGLSEDDFIHESVFDNMLSKASKTGVMSQTDIDSLIRGMVEASRDVTP